MILLELQNIYLKIKSKDMLLSLLALLLEYMV
jgi:hypothetical protein